MDNILEDLYERGERASAELLRMIGERSRHSPEQIRRLKAKREGVDLVLGYIDEARREENTS